MRARGSAGKALNEGHRRGLNLQKPIGVRISTQPVLTEWMTRFAKQLDVFGETMRGLVQDESVQEKSPVVAIADDNLLEELDTSGIRNGLNH
ncbi:hypothetical protein V6N13_138139 [Hibiscus sabdariffa]|uniref:Uncharacterized protein n=1 Tax=Hibiscus sabdariffa TaxID=183260 RepID=A0ABR2QCR4_9ROSI